MKQDILNKCPKKVDIIGVPISVVNMKSSLSFVSNNFEDIRGEYICASNVHTTVMAYEESNYLEVQCNSVLSLPDGKPLSFIGRRKGLSDMDKVTGTDFAMNVFTDSRFEGKRHFFYGTTIETLEKMINKLQLDYPTLKVCGYEPSIFRELTDKEVDELSNRINEVGADFVWIAIGAPRQELLMDRLKGKVNSVMVGIGGAFNIFAGIVKNAPVWIQNIGFEWLYRLCNEPRRLFKRYLTTNSRFLYLLLVTKYRNKKKEKYE